MQHLMKSYYHVLILVLTLGVGCNQKKSTELELQPKSPPEIASIKSPVSKDKTTISNQNKIDSIHEFVSIINQTFNIDSP